VCSFQPKQPLVFWLDGQSSLDCLAGGIVVAGSLLRVGQ
jgi:hypothetical protein